MTKLTLTDIGSTLTNTAATAINENNNRIVTALENTLSRDGTTPNQMSADIDMNNNDLLNVGSLDVETFTVDGVLFPGLSAVLLVANNLSDIPDDAAARTNIGLGNVNNTSDLSKPISTATQAALDDKADLGIDGKVPASQLPVDGSYLGTWNATTNTPTIVSSTGVTNTFYVVATAGTTNIDGVASWAIGDHIRFNGTVWQKISNSAAVASVNGLTGTVVLTATNIGSSATGSVAATNVQAAIAELDGEKVAKAGDTMSGNLAMGSNKITGLASGTSAADAITKAQLDASSAMTVQTFSASGTWTKPAGCVRAIFEAVGGGGGGGGVDGTGTSTYGAAGGGASGFYGMTGPLNVSAVTSAAVTIGAAGSGGAAGNNAGTAGGATSITISGTTYTWGGGQGAAGFTANAGGIAAYGGDATGTNVVGFSRNGGIGIANINTNCMSGDGSDSPLGSGGGGQRLASTGNTNGANGSGFGSGGSGGVTNNTSNNAAGGNGTGGYMRVWEFY